MSRVYKEQPFAKDFAKECWECQGNLLQCFINFYPRMKMLDHQLHDSNVHTFQCVFAIHQMKGTSFVHQGAMGFKIYVGIAFGFSTYLQKDSEPCRVSFSINF
jgi:hypothetical protein